MVAERTPAPRAAPGEAPADETGVRHGLSFAAVGWLVSQLAGGLAIGIVLGVTDTPAGDVDELPLGWLAVAQLGLWVGLLGAPYVAARRSSLSMRRAFGLRVEAWDVPVGAFLGFVGQFAILWIVYLPLQWFVDINAEEISEPARNMTDRATDPLGVFLLVLIVGVGAPIIEEIFYRGLLQRSLVRRFGVRWGIGIASVLFGAAHLQLLQLPALALAGVLFGVLAHHFGRLGPAISAHVVFNMTAVVSLLVTT